MLKHAASTLALALTFSLAARAQAPELLQYAKERSGRSAYGLYLFGKKAGWMLLEERVVEGADGKPVFESSMTTRMRAAAEGEIEVTKSTETSRYSLSGRGLLQSFEMRDEENGRATITKGQRTERGVEVTIQTPNGNNPVRHTLPMPNAGLREDMGADRWMQDADPEDPDARVRKVWTMDLENPDGEERITVRLVKRETRRLGGVEVQVATFRAKMQGVPAVIEGTSFRQLLKVQVGTLMEMRLEPEEIAKQLDSELPDVVLDAALRAKGKLGGEPFVLEFENADKFEFPHSPRQKVSKRDGVVSIRLNASGYSSDPKKLTDAERTEALRNIPRLAITHPRIVETAKRAIGDRKNKPRAIYDYVLETLDKSYGANAMDAVSVLANKAGDCSEHAMLFVSLARASGVPAREVGGLVAWQEAEDEVLFAHHAWAEFHDGKRWIAIDPIFGEFPVHVAHVKFGAVDDLSWFDVAGDATVRIVSR